MKEKIILITGASSGIGKATAEILGGGKNKLIICGRRKDRLEKLRSQINGEVHILNFDVRDKKSVFFRGLIRTLGQPKFQVQNWTNSSGDIWSKPKCIPLYFAFGHHVTKSPGLHRFAILSQLQQNK